jgi:hypothetical protein
MTIRIDGTNTAANPGITGSDTDTGLQFGTDEVNIVTGGSTAVTVDSSQRVGIGTASPSYLLDIRGSSPDIQLNDTDASGQAYRIQSTNGALRLVNTGVGERLRILSTGGLTFNGDTAAANALDDYEEGTWTPRLTGSVSGNYTPGGSNTGWYRKVGNVVTVGGTLQWSGQVTAYSGYLLISGLPFANGANRAGGVIGGGSGLNLTSGYNRFLASLDISSSSFYILQISSTNNTYSHYPTVSTSGIIYGFTLTYGTS